MKRVFICAGGPVEEVVDLRQLPFLQEETIFIGADRGAYHLLNADIIPTEIIGDFDSISYKELDTLRKHVTHVSIMPSEKDETDTRLALLEAMKYKPNEVILTGVSGSRLDHYQAALHDVYHFQRLHPEVSFYIQNNKNKLQFLLPGTHKIDQQEEYKYISFYPFGEGLEDVTLDGFLYNVEEEPISYGHAKFTSNEQVERTSTISFKSGICLMIRSSD
ncbi:thiamine diphosphokinase [Psychrobacillus sp. BL-248-WT-3]|uniref:thiamine diphosphokinase n=1 Tax=Psychrobacillus sp. BL-248-WT-3 TaxID=2725306 RepID=UPI00146EB01C|nr:thiamine diphosphokinase [Psychrobacillus sp. BL-248-WT-3]NME04794.1 thiamine diphosphokinase [Psychrobacillus sp. BL-248-WT-3]